MPGSVDGGNMNQCIVPRIKYSPARAAVGRIPNNVECAPDIRELGDRIVPNVGYFKTRPLSPFEHATLVREPLGLSNL